MCMFPACYFRQKTYIAQGLVNGILNETRPHSCLHEYIYIYMYTNALLLNRIGPEIEKILRNNENDFRRNSSSISRIRIIRRMLEGTREKAFQQHTYL